MDDAQTIRQCMADVSALRQARSDDQALERAYIAIKAVQSQRFRASYADLLASGVFAPAAEFFLAELYGEGDYAARDAQFARIAGTVQALFPAPVVTLALALAQLHARTEALDHAMALAWMHGEGCTSARYVAAWQAVGEIAARQWQLDSVLDMGQRLAQLTQTPGLRMMLRMMRRPACAAGLGQLQHFLEAGFDTFGQLTRSRGAVAEFLETIKSRESAFIAMLFNASAANSAQWLQQALDVAEAPHPYPLPKGARATGCAAITPSPSGRGRG